MSDITREVMNVDVLLVGAGPSSLACAYELAKRVNEHNAAIDAGTLTGNKVGPLEIAILEKGSEVGDCILSGAVMDPSGIEALIPDWKEKGAPIESAVTGDATVFLTRTGTLELPVTPPPLQQHGYYIISLSKFTRWMAEQVQALGVNIFTGFTGREMLYDDKNRVIGVRTGDKGINKHGERKSNFEAGIDIHAKVTILGEGVRGSLTRDHMAKLGLDSETNPPSFATGVKEVWELRPGAFEKGYVYHTMGFPQARGRMGGGWLYGMDNNRLSLGYVTWLSSADPYSNPHQNFQTFKTHPFVKKILEGGKLVQYGAKAVSVGGYYSIPKNYGDGFLIIGESSNIVDGQRLKGVHLAIASGQMAAGALLEAFKKQDFSENTLALYRQVFEASEHKKKLMLSRNFHQAFDGGFLKGLIRSGLQTALKGRDLLAERLPSHKDREHMQKVLDFYGTPFAKDSPMKFDNTYLFDRLTDVFNSGTIHEEDQPAHLLVPDRNLCATKCTEEYQNPCTRFCPAQVYEVEPKNGRMELKLNPSNCVHCKTCDIMDPYTNITWVPPEGGGGPRYSVL